MTRSSFCHRVVLGTVVLGILFAGLALAQQGPAADPLAVGHCARVTPAASADLGALAKTATPKYATACYWAIYEEFVKNGDVCRSGDTCWNQYTGSCPDGWDQHYTEIFECCR